MSINLPLMHLHDYSEIKIHQKNYENKATDKRVLSTNSKITIVLTIQQSRLKRTCWDTKVPSEYQ